MEIIFKHIKKLSAKNMLEVINLKMTNKVWVGVGLAAAAATAVAVTPMVKNMTNNKTLSNALSMNQGKNSIH